MHLVDDRLRPRRHRRAGAGTGGRRSDGLGHERAAVLVAEREIQLRIAGFVAEHRRMQDERPVEHRGERVDQQLGRIEPLSLQGVERSVGSQSVSVSGAQVLDVAMEDVAGALGQTDAFQLACAFGIKQAELDRRGVGREHRHVGAAIVEGQAQRLGGSCAKAPVHGRRALAGLIRLR